MWILEPFVLQAAAVEYSNIAEDDADAWSAGTYDTGQVFLHNNSVWRCLRDGVTSEPSASAESDWFRRGPANKFRPFDQGNDTQAERADQITYEVVPGKRLDRVWLLGLDAVSVRLEIVAGGQSVYDKTISALRSENRGSFYSWLFARKEYKTKLAFIDIPTYPDVPNARFNLTIDRPGGIAKVGEILFGQNWVVGATRYQSEPRILNFSRDTRDSFGSAVLTSRRSSREVRYRVLADPQRLDYIFDRFEGLTATKLLFSAGGDLDSLGTTVFGTLRDLSAPIDAPDDTNIEIQARGFIA